MINLLIKKLSKSILALPPSITSSHYPSINLNPNVDHIALLLTLALILISIITLALSLSLTQPQS